MAGWIGMALFLAIIDLLLRPFFTLGLMLVVLPNAVPNNSYAIFNVSGKLRLSSLLLLNSEAIRCHCVSNSLLTPIISLLPHLLIRTLVISSSLSLFFSRSLTNLNDFILFNDCGMLNFLQDIHWIEERVLRVQIS